MYKSSISRVYRLIKIQLLLFLGARSAGLNEQPLSAVRLQGKPGFRIVQCQVVQHKDTALQLFQVSGLLQRRKMLLVDGHAVLAQLSEEVPAPLTAP